MSCCRRQLSKIHTPIGAIVAPKCRPGAAWRAATSFFLPADFASTQPPGEALSPKHEAFVQAYVSNGMNGTKAYRAVYPSIKSDDVAGAAAARLLGNVRVQARIAEIMRAGAERAEVTVEQVVRELKLLGFSDIRKVVSWRNELVTRTEKGEDGEPVMVVMPRVTIVDADKISDEAAAAVAEVSQTVNGALRVG